MQASYNLHVMPRAKERDGVFQRKDRHNAWFVSFIDGDGERRKQKVEAHTRTQALEQRRRIVTKIEREVANGVKEASNISTAELLKRFKRYQKARLRPSTFERLDGILKTLEAGLPEQAKAITKRTVAGYIEGRAETVKPGTVSKEMSVLKHCLKLAVEWGELNQNPAAGARLPKLPPGRTRYLTPGEFRATLEAAPEWMRGPIAFAVATGMRRGSLLGLKWMDVDFKHNRIYLRTTKTGTMQVLPLTDAARHVLNAVLDHTGPAAPSDLVFAGLDGQKLSVYIRRVFCKLGIEDASFHTLRHTAASWLVQEGVDLYAVGTFLGHKTPRMTARYAHLSPDYMAKAAGKLDAVMARALPAESSDEKQSE
jgi:integrase